MLKQLCCIGAMIVFKGPIHADYIYLNNVNVGTFVVGVHCRLFVMAGSVHDDAFLRCHPVMLKI